VADYSPMFSRRPPMRLRLKNVGRDRRVLLLLVVYHGEDSTRLAVAKPFRGGSSARLEKIETSVRSSDRQGVLQGTQAVMIAVSLPLGTKEEGRR
jgi:hypothetical protein